MEALGEYNIGCWRIAQICFFCCQYRRRTFFLAGEASVSCHRPHSPSGVNISWLRKRHIYLFLAFLWDLHKYWINIYCLLYILLVGKLHNWNKKLELEHCWSNCLLSWTKKYVGLSAKKTDRGFSAQVEIMRNLLVVINSFSFWATFFVNH